VGRSCSKNLTGYNWSLAQAERIERFERMDRDAEAKYGDLYRSLKSQGEHEGRVLGYGGFCTEAWIWLRDLKPWMDEAYYVEYAEKALAESIAKYGEDQR
jgi:hypothetical protein